MTVPLASSLIAFTWQHSPASPFDLRARSQARQQEAALLYALAQRDSVAEQYAVQSSSATHDTVAEQPVGIALMKPPTHVPPDMHGPEPLLELAPVDAAVDSDPVDDPTLALSPVESAALLLMMSPLELLFIEPVVLPLEVASLDEDPAPPVFAVDVVSSSPLGRRS